MSIDQRTIQTYDNAAVDMAAHFQQYKGGNKPDDANKEELDLAFSLVPSEPLVIEIGCGAGKHAAQIVQRTSRYEGFDPSEKLLDVARQQAPGASFVQADALSYQYPPMLPLSVLLLHFCI